jgi:pyruvate formate lyase activating enzyme
VEKWFVKRFCMPITPAASIHRVAEIGKAAGLKYFCCGNLPGDAGENTPCDRCGRILIGRFGFAVSCCTWRDRHTPHCGAPFYGIFR